jgi:hypothetical protein
MIALPPCKIINVSDRMNRMEAIKVIAAGRVGELEYWNRNDGRWEGGWDRERHAGRVKALFHEASTTFMTEDFGPERIPAPDEQLPSVDKTYRPYGLNSEKGNVFVTGAGLFPTAGSWNRMLHLPITIPASILT